MGVPRLLSSIWHSPMTSWKPPEIDPFIDGLPIVNGDLPIINGDVPFMDTYKIPLKSH